MGDPFSEAKTGETSNEFAQMAEKVFSEWLESNSGNVSVEVCKNIRRLMSLSIEHEESGRQYIYLRKKKWPWILNPSAWAVRSKCKQLKSRVYSLTQQIYNRQTV
jgi:hypothetical protein